MSSMSFSNSTISARTPLVAPWGKNLAFTFGSGFVSWNLHDIRYAKPSQLPNLPCCEIFTAQPPTDELKIFSTRRVGKNRDARYAAAMHEVYCLHGSRSFASSRSSRRRNHRNSSTRNVTMSGAPTNSATVNCQPGRPA